MSVKDYQANLETLLGQHFNEHDISIEWQSKMNKGIYSPRVDVAVGPFAIEDGVQLTARHEELFEESLALLSRLAEQHLINLDLINNQTTDIQRWHLIQDKLHHLRAKNMNGRCFLAIEVENKSSRKHLMGGAVNAAVLGKVGVAIGYTKIMHKSFLNLYRYFQFLRQVDKPTFNTSNLLIISKNQFEDILTME